MDGLQHSEPEISVLIVAHNKAGYTKRCLDSLFLSSFRPFHAVIVDNGSTDSTPAIFDAFEARAESERISVSRLTFGQNVGAIVSRNLGLSRMRGNYWVFLDNDVLVRTRSWLEKLKAVLDKYPQVGVTGPKLVYALPPHDIQCAGCTVTQGGQIIFEGRGKSRQDPAYHEPRNCQTIISATWMLRADIAKRIGPLDEQFSPVQFEDHDYCYRIRELGYGCRYEPSVEMYHFENVTTGQTSSLNYPYLTVKNGMKFKNKWRHRFSKENGPLDADWKWADISTVLLENVPEKLEILS